MFAALKWYQGLMSQLKGLRSGQEVLRRQFNGLLTLLGTLVRLLHSRKALSDDELGEVLTSYSSLVSSTSATSANPLTVTEAETLRGYVSKAQRGEFFTAQEVEEYNTLVKKLEEEKGGDPGVWPLVALGAFLFGLFVASKAAKK